MEEYAPMLRNIRVDVCATSAAEIGVGDAPASRGGSRLPLIQHVGTYDEALFHAIAAQDFEGVVAKRVDASYRAGRQPAWVKIKNRDYSRRAAVEWQGR